MPDIGSDPMSFPTTFPLTNAEGTFTFTVTQNTIISLFTGSGDSKQCIININIIVQEVNLTITGPPNNCEAIQTFTATPGLIDYEWTVSGNGTIISQSDNEMTVDWGSSTGQANTVTVTAVDPDTGCKGEYIFELDQCCFEDIFVGIDPTFSTICLGDEITLNAFLSPNATTPVTYSWSSTPFDPSLALQQGQSTITVSPQTGTDYTLSIEDANGCTASALALVFVQTFGDLPELIAPENACCTDQTYSVSGDFASYDWDVDGGTIVSGQGTNEIIIEWDEFGDGGTIFLEVSDGVCTETVEFFIEGCCTRDDIDDSEIFLKTDYCGTVLISDFGYQDGDEIFVNEQYIIVNTDVVIDVDLTIIVANVLVAPGKKIEVLPGKTFTLRRSVVQAKCEEMWDGFYVEDPTAHLFLYGDASERNQIYDAENAVVSNNGGRFTIISDLINNYKGVVVNEFNGTHSGVIEDALITSVTGDLLPPHADPDSRTFTGVEINDVQDITIGVAPPSGTNTSMNTFRNLRIGIETNLSNVTIVNNLFEQIIPIPPILPLVPQWNHQTGIGIKSHGHENLFEFQPPFFVLLPVYNTTVGGTGPNETNYFTDCYKGVDIINRVALTAEENEFDDITTAGILTSNTIFFANHEIRNNLFNDCHHGVYSRVFTFTTIDIEDNEFTSMKPWTGVLIPQLNRAIRAENISTTASVSIVRNKIHLPERGIQVVGVVNNGLTITRNEIEYPTSFTNNNIPTAPLFSKFYRGISIEGCSGALVTNNLVRRFGMHSQGLAAVQDHFRGIFAANSADAQIIHNQIQGFGGGLYVDGSNPNATYNCNRLIRNYAGIDFNNATIGDQGANNQPNGNRWIQNFGPVRMDGNTVAITDPSEWWHRQFGNTSPDPKAVPTTNGVDFFITNGNDRCRNVVIGTVPFNPVFSPAARENLFGPIVRDERQFNAFNDAHRRWEMLYLQRHLRNENDWFNLGAADDNDYINFFNQNAQTCLGQLEEARVQLDSCAFDTAAVFVNQVVPATIHEDNLKTAREIYLNTYAVGNFEFTPQQYNTLADIACQYALEGGEGVYIARALLGEDLDCGGVEQKSGTNDNPIKVEQKEDKIKIYPNPTRDQVTIEGMNENSTIEVRNMSGQLLFTKTPNSRNMTISLTDLAPGTYIVNIVGAEGNLEERKKIVIIR